jgi:TRAP-type C4-dicarboxylate transport system permease small subunit
MEVRAVNQIDKAVDTFNKSVGFAVKVVNILGVISIGLMVLMLLVGVVGRKFNMPLKGDVELSQVGLLLLTFFFVSATYFKDDKMVMDSLTMLFPKKIKNINDTVIFLLDFVILGVLAWQLFVQAMMSNAMHRVTPVLQIPFHYFLYIAAICASLLTLVYVMHFLNTLRKVWRA